MTLEIPQMDYFEGGAVMISVLRDGNVTLQRSLEVNIAVELGMLCWSVWRSKFHVNCSFISPTDTRLLATFYFTFNFRKPN